MAQSTSAKSDSGTSRPIVRLLDLLGKRWSLRILWELRDARMTFRELRERCDDVSPTSLNNRLKELKELGLVDHDSTGFGYSVLGAELGVQLLSLSEWSERWDRER